ncbi:hypothetical protein [Klebsiella oxytoca]|uniref:hypothetical protein n=1 Tax=Klebsiella oxytoca TaxID=571 RepID=UPI00163CB1EC|nr:hypothetical protein [Klebsiella oxytoca]EIY2868736.1 hypothetical protein [Klebsiella oxytoca]EKQ7194603.1 hypothetical protein [Klebsiella oxytoca]QTV83712.1 hypothetical protein KAT64_01015 [Klebsiella oxytoca]WBD83350.1 hypothetical protein OGU21_01170 [Klebsiella oxytoca]HBM3267778.1 hypothetical protein [Klebsiella oxytoca]
MDAFFHTLSKQRLFPEAMLRICPGYLPADDAEPVARARRFAPPPGAVCGAAEFPGGDAAHLSGLPARRRR